MPAHRTIVRACSLALLAVTSGASSASAQDSTALPGSFLFGAGLNLHSRQGSPLALQLGKEWRAKDSRFGLRLSGGYTAAATGPLYSYTYSSDANGYAPTETFQVDDKTFSLGLGVTYALATGRVQPYLLSGVLMQNRIRHGSSTFADGTPLPVGVDPATRRFDYRHSDLSFGMEAGAGLQARVGRFWLYTEVRRQLSTDNGPQWIQHPSPLTFGLRF